jgi:DNA-directed RNA polymerase I, II, and III subunit RPABC2
MSYFQDSDDNDSIKSSGSENEDSDVELDTKINKQKPKTVVLAGDEELGDDESVPDDDEVEDDDDDESVPDDEEDEDDDVGKGVDQPDDNYDEEDVDGDASSDEEGEGETKRVERKKKITIASSNVGKKGTVPKISDLNLSDDEDEDEDEEGELYLKKFDKDINDNYLLNFHPECALHNYDEVLTMTKVVRDKTGIIIDDLHKTIPYLTKYERARILGQRAKQINSGATVFVKVPENVIDGYLIAELELKEKRIPFIIRRPLPNGGSEYWSVRDLENIIF